MRPLRETIALAIVNARRKRAGRSPALTLNDLTASIRLEAFDDSDSVIVALFDEGHMAHPNEGVSDR